jgi:membrane fusion protein (multidrug efflux system)
VARVSLQPATVADLPIVVQCYGAVEFDPLQIRTLNTEIEARVLALDVAPGEPVARDQVIARLAPSSAGNTELEQARTDALNARKTAARSHRLRSDGLASDADVEAAETAASDAAALASGLESRSAAIQALRAPVDGVVDELPAAVGELLPPGSAIARLAVPDTLQARLGIDVGDVRAVHDGQPVQLRSLDRGEVRLDAVVALADRRVDPVTRMATALVPLPAGAEFLAGEAVRASIVVGTRSAVVTVPRAAVLEDESGPYVYVASDGSAALRRIQTGLTSGERTEVRSGLVAGEMIVVNGAAALSDGMRISTQVPDSAP